MPIDTAAQRAALLRTRAAAIRELRLVFDSYGLDVSAYSDDQVSAATLAEATAATCSSWDLFLRAFDRLHHPNAPGAVP